MSAGAGAARVLGVAGAGTIGSGIAQLAVHSHARCVLHDAAPHESGAPGD